MTTKPNKEKCGGLRNVSPSFFTFPVHFFHFLWNVSQIVCSQFRKQTACIKCWMWAQKIMCSVSIWENSNVTRNATFGEQQLTYKLARHMLFLTSSKLHSMLWLDSYFFMPLSWCMVEWFISWATCFQALCLSSNPQKSVCLNRGKDYLLSMLMLLLKACLQLQHQQLLFLCCIWLKKQSMDPNFDPPLTLLLYISERHMCGYKF